MKKIFFLMALACLALACRAQSTSPLKDGLFVVASELKSVPSTYAPEANKALAPFNKDFLDNAPDSVTALIVYTNDFVPLELAEEPQLQKQAGRNSRLQLTFSRLASDKLGDFTQKNLMKHVALVVNGQALTMHRVRAAITGGKLEVSRCSDNACEQLYVELKDDVRK